MDVKYHFAAEAFLSYQPHLLFYIAFSDKIVYNEYKVTFCEIYGGEK